MQCSRFRLKNFKFWGRKSRKFGDFNPQIRGFFLGEKGSIFHKNQVLGTESRYLRTRR